MAQRLAAVVGFGWTASAAEIYTNNPVCIQNNCDAADT